MDFRIFRPNDYQMLDEGTYQFYIKDITVNEVNGVVSMMLNVINIETHKKGSIMRKIYLLDKDGKLNNIANGQLRFICKACYGGKAPDELNLLDLKDKYFIADLSIYKGDSNSYYNYKNYDVCEKPIILNNNKPESDVPSWY